MAIPSSVEIIEVGPRDGLQNVSEFLDTEKKITLLKLLIESGVKRIEATSFVHPKTVPQFRDAKEVMTALIHRPGIRLRALVPNLVGTKNALAVGVRDFSFVFSVSVSESHKRPSD